jgi:hypothetical protein
MDSAQGQADLGVEGAGQPVRFRVRAGRPGAQDLDEQQVEDAGDHHRRSLRGRLHLEHEHPAGHLEPFERRAAGAAQDDHWREALEQVARPRVADREGSAEPARPLGRGRAALAGVADVVRVAAGKQDDIAGAHALGPRDAVDPEREFALFDDVQAAGAGEADRERPRRSVPHDPFPAQPDAAEQFREQVMRLAGRGEAERGVLESGLLERWRIGKPWRRLEQIGCGRWTIGKISRRSGHGRCPFL